jgi:C4-dicarboxylate transporter DctM subunit
MIWTVLLSVLLLTVVSSATLGAAFGLTGMVILRFFVGSTDEAVIAVYNIFSSFTLSAIPMLIFLGELLISSGISERMYGAISPLFERVPGRLLHTNILLCGFFAAVSGTSTATAAAVGSASYPELVRRGYNKATVVGSLAGAGALGILLPPSLSLIVYGALQNVSISGLFLGTLLPAALVIGLFMTYVFVLGVIKPELTPSFEKPMSFVKAVKSAAGAWPLLALMISVLGSIYGGLATTTEAAGLGVIAVLVIGFTVGDLTVQKVIKSLIKSVVNYGAIKFVVMGAYILSQSISVLALPSQLVQTVLALGLSKYTLILVVTVLFLALGCLFEGLSLMLLTVSFVYPVFVNLGFHPIWIGIYLTLMIEISLIHPPLGVNLFILSAITQKEVPLAAIAWATVPYWLLMLVATALITFYPQIVLFVPLSHN